MYTLIPGPGWPRACVGVVPVDDHHCLRFQVSYNPEAPITTEPPFTKRELGTFDLPGGENISIDTWVPTLNRRNLYSLRRERQRTINYSGIEGIETQDRAMTEGMGYICDRSQEHLGSSDLAVIAMRRQLERLAQQLQQGRAPVAARLHHLYGVRPLDVIAPQADLRDLLEDQTQATRMAVTAGT
jgi:hypothetical protein